MVKLHIELDSGFRKELEFSKRESKISLANWKIESIDLTPLSSCKNLATLDLIGNSIEYIELTPLGSCKKLQRLWLKDNEIEKLDLSPLSTCHDLRELSVTGNQLREIDLHPLQECANLELLGLGQNRFKTISLEPLTDCKNLDTLYLYRNRFKTIDLSPLRSLSRLKELYLYWNELEEIELSPLSSCLELEILQLQSNLLRSIDLTPLNHCTSLKELNLSRNMLTSIDLEPLSGCTRLGKFGLSENQLQDLDLSPLAMCEGLYVVYLEENRFRTLDLTPLGLSSGLESSSFDVNFKVSSNVQWLETLYSEPNFWGLPDEITVSLQYDAPVFCKDLRVITQILDSIIENEPGWKTTHLLHNMLSLLELGWLGMLDVDAGPFLTELLRLQRDYGKESVLKRVLVQISTQIESGLTTIGLDEQRMTECPELADKYDKVINLRKGELEQVVVVKTDSGLDLRPLWLTAYGFLVLNTLGLGTSCGHDDAKMIRQALSDLGFDLQINQLSTNQNATEISRPLREYIWILADYKSNRRRMGLKNGSFQE
ncbi:MAG: leucine-rich repeat domain-containing protein [Candidatus Thorarchaeota archaeon]